MSTPSPVESVAAPENEEQGGGWFPPARWLPKYRAAYLPADLVAGVTLAAYAVPVSLAYAGLAGLPPEKGLYGYLLGGIGYALFGSSRHLALGPTSAISLMVAGAVTTMAGGDAVLYGQIATLAGFTVAAMCVVAWALRLSALTSFISETILMGFKAGAGLTIAMTQLPALLGVKGGGHNFIERVGTLAGQLGDTRPWVAAVGFGALALLLVGEKVLPRKPVALMVVVLSIAAVSLTSLGGVGLPTVGSVPQGLPDFALPALRLRDVDGIVPLAFGCLLLAFIEGVSAARTFADKHGYALDVRQELLGLGAANLLVAFGGGYPVGGGLSQSAVNESGGAKTQMSLVFASATLAVCLLFLTGLVADLPKAVLSAIVLVAVKGLINVRGIYGLRRVSRLEFRVALVALGGVLLLGILNGIILAALCSLLVLIARAAYPNVAFLGRIPGTDRYSDAARNPDNEPTPGALVFRVESSLLYFNVDHVARAVRERLRAAGDDLRLVVCDLSSSPVADLAGVRMLGALRDELAAKGVAFRAVEARSSVRDMLRASGVEARVGGVDRRDSVAGALADLAPPPARQG